MMKTVDARGLTCPQPVVLTKREFDQGAAEINTLVDNEAACENLTRLGQSLGCEVTVNTENDSYSVILSRNAGAAVVGNVEVLRAANDVVLIASEYFGRGEAELGAILMKSFLYALNEAPERVKTLIFMNSGVKLVSEGSPVIDLLQSIAGKGIDIYACGTCLDYYHLKEQLAAGSITNMYSALEMMQQAVKVLTV